MWPFSKPPVEEREATYTDAVVEALVRSATGVDANPIATAAVAAASGLWGRCFAMAAVDPSEQRTGLTGAVLADIGRAFVETGESVWLIEVRGGQVTLTRASDHDVTGDGSDETRWRYRLSLGGPTGIRQVNVSASQVFHPRINVDPAQPHRGRSPVALAGAGGKLTANLESSLASETGAPSGNVLPAPLQALGPEPLKLLKADLRALKGRTALVESMGKGWGDGAAGAPSDWKQSRIGADPPEVLARLADEAAKRIMAACGVPPTMFATGGDAAGMREAFRQFVFTTVMPVAAIMQREAETKLGVPVGFDFSALGAADTQGRARSFKAMIDGGMPLDDARRLSGLA